MKPMGQRAVGPKVTDRAHGGTGIHGGGGVSHVAILAMREVPQEVVTMAVDRTEEDQDPNLAMGRRRTSRGLPCL